MHTCTLTNMRDDTASSLRSKPASAVATRTHQRAARPLDLPPASNAQSARQGRNRDGAATDHTPLGCLNRTSYNRRAYPQSTRTPSRHLTVRSPTTVTHPQTHYALPSIHTRLCSSLSDRTMGSNATSAYPLRGSSSLFWKLQSQSDFVGLTGLASPALLGWGLHVTVCAWSVSVWVGPL
jgi:hypothetical protein